MKGAARKLALAVCDVWKELRVPHAGFQSIHDKTAKLLAKQRIKRRPDGPLIPEGEHLFDIAACKCFFGISPDQMSLDQCRCEENPWDQVSFQLYGNQRGSRNLKAWFVTNTRDTRSEDAVAADADQRGGRLRRCQS